MAIHYARTLTFECPECHLPVLVTRTSEHGNMEDVAAWIFQVECESCRHVAEIPGLFASRHNVKDMSAKGPVVAD